MSTLLKLNNIKCKDYCNLKGYKYSVIEEEKPQKIYIPNYDCNKREREYIQTTFPEKYIAELENVIVLGRNNVIFDKEGYCIYDMTLRNDGEKFVYSPPQNAVKIGKLTTEVNYIYSGIDIEEGIMLISSTSPNYYHFNLEIISKLILIDKIPAYKDIPIIMDEETYRILQLREELEKVNKQKRKIIRLSPNYGYRFKKLIHISELAILPFSIVSKFQFEYDDVYISDLAINLLREELVVKTEKLFRKIYVSRGARGTRRMYNSFSVEDIFKSYGYEIVNPESISFEEQLKLFSEANTIAGVSGAGLTNIIFANEKAKFICILPKEIKLGCYSTIAGIIGQEYYFLDASLNNSLYTWDMHQRPFYLDQNYLKNYLEALK